MTAISKKYLRKTCLADRQNMAEPLRLRAEKQIIENFFASVSFKEGQIIAGYWPIRGEVDARLILNALTEKGYICALPVVTDMDQALDFRVWDEKTPMAEGAFGIKTPKAEEAEVVEPDIILTPLCAFQKNCHRLGYGGGFYDRTLADLRKKKEIQAIGLAFDMQCLDDFATEPHDEPLDKIITERKVYKR